MIGILFATGMEAHPFIEKGEPDDAEDMKARRENKQSPLLTASKQTLL